MRRHLRAGALSVCIAIAASGGAKGQALPDAIQGAMNRAAGVVQQSAGSAAAPAKPDPAPPPAAAGAKPPAAEPTPPAPPPRTRLPVDRNSFARVSTPSHNLANGVVLQTTGDFIPEPKAR